MTDRGSNPPATRTDWALEKLSEQILTGRLEPGQRLKAEALAGAWNVSPTPVREAIQRLTALGLVDAIPNRGVRVASVAVEEMHEVYALRMLLEPLALRLSLGNRDAEIETTVKEALLALEAELFASHSDVFAFENAHTAFHQALLSGCRAAWLSRIIETLRTHSVRYRLLAIGPRGGREDVMSDHRDLTAVCLEGTVEEAVERLFVHIRLTVDSLGGDQGPVESADVAGLLALMDAAATLTHLESPA